MTPVRLGLVGYDEELAGRLRDLLGGEPRLTEKVMFGGLAFLINGNMAISASGQGGVLVRVDPTDSDELVDGSAAEVAVMRGRPIEGWFRVAPEHLVTEQQLGKWVGLGAASALASCQEIDVTASPATSGGTDGAGDGGALDDMTGTSGRVSEPVPIAVVTGDAPSAGTFGRRRPL